MPADITPRGSSSAVAALQQQHPPRSLWEASEEGDLERVSALVLRPPSERQLKAFAGPYGWTALAAATHADQRDVMRLLLKSQADPNLQDANGDLVPLHWASSPEATQLLLDAKADPGVRNRDGRTPLEQARRWKQDEVAEVLQHHLDAALVAAAKSPVKSRAPE